MTTHALPTGAKRGLLTAFFLLSGLLTPPAAAQTVPVPSRPPIPTLPVVRPEPAATEVPIPAEPQQVIGVAPDALPGRTGDPITGILAVRAEGGTVVRLFDAGTGRLRRVVTLPPEVMPEVSPAISPDGKWLAVAIRTERSSTDGWVGLLSTFSPPRYLYFMRTQGLRGTTSFTFSPDGTRLAVGNLNSYVQLWELGPNAGRRLETLKGNFPPEAMVFSPDSRLLMTRFRGQLDTKLLDAVTGKVVSVLPTPTGDWLPGGLFLAPDGRTFLAQNAAPLPLPVYLADGARPAGFDRAGQRVLVTLPPLPTQPEVTSLELREVATGKALSRHVLANIRNPRLMPDGEHALIEGEGGLRLLSLR